MQSVAEQYERHPYPSIPLLAIPRTASTHAIAYELGQYLRTGRFVAHDRTTRILVAGAGTFEPLVIRRAHARAEIVALDLSAAALRRLRWRERLTTLGLRSRIDRVQGDLHDDLRQRLGSFDYIVCTGVIHHSPTPERLLANLSALLKPTGVLRVMTYAANSRRWIYELQRFFKERGTSPNLRACERELAALPEQNPRSVAHRAALRAAFESYEDRLNPAGLIDGFFHACDRPLKIENLAQATAAAGLKLIGFGHAWHSQPAGLQAQLTNAAVHTEASREVLRAYEKLDAWSRLACVDALGELAVNPVLWLAKEAEDVVAEMPGETKLNPALTRLKNDEPFAAPLAPAPEGELLATLTKRLAAEDIESGVIGGVWLGCDGRLPPALVANRALVPPRFALPASSTTRELSPHDAALRGVNEFFALLGQAPSPETLGLLTRALEPRIDRNGHELAGLSTGDELRALAKRATNDAALLRELALFAD